MIKVNSSAFKKRHAGNYNCILMNGLNILLTKPLNSKYISISLIFVEYNTIFSFH